LPFLPSPQNAISRGPVKDGPVAENFVTYFYEECITTLIAPLAALPDYKTLGGASHGASIIVSCRPLGSPDRF
jgi:hypothetical protein